MRQPQAGCNAPSAIITAAAQFIDIADVTPQACSSKPIDYSYSLGYHVSPSLHQPAVPFTRPQSREPVSTAQMKPLGLSGCANCIPQPGLLIEVTFGGFLYCDVFCINWKRLLHSVLIAECQSKYKRCGERGCQVKKVRGSAVACSYSGCTRHAQTACSSKRPSLHSYAPGGLVSVCAAVKPRKA